jgi:two-component system chemotaxis sensor kinase CheA
VTERVETEDEMVLRVFFTECLELLSDIESQLLAIESAGEKASDEAINRVFRAAHSIKGGAATLNLLRMRDLSHKVESILSLVRSRALTVNSEINDILLRSFDRLRNLVELGMEGEKEDISEHLTLLSSVLAEQSKEGTGPVGADVKPGPAPSIESPPAARVETGAQTPPSEPEAESVQGSTAAGGGKPGAAEGASAASDLTLRVSVNLLESLMNLAGELVLGRNQLTDAVARNDIRSIAASGQKVSMVTSELQETIMLTRMQPIGNVLNRFPRIVRDLSRELGKDVQIEISGKEVAVDKTIVEALSDPLTHMVRNAVDHGIETPDVRRSSGKLPMGQITIKAYHEAGQIIIEIADDGKGMDSARIAASAVSKNLIGADQVKAMSEKDLLGLIFLPGLSTAEKVSDVSGRGVGMDVVKSNLEKLGGKVEIETRLGEGSRFKIKLPLTLAIIPSLLVSVGEERFAIPQINIVELIRIPAEQVKRRVEVVGDVEVLVLRGELIPLVGLASVLRIPSTYVDPASGGRKPDRRTRISDRRSPHFSADGHEEESGSGSPSKDEGRERREGDGRRFHASSELNIVIVNSGSLRYGMVVEKLHETLEIVVKPLGIHLKGLREYAGSTIMGDGQVALILDVNGIALVAGLSALTGTERAHQLQEQNFEESHGESHSFLIFRNAATEQIAVPLELVWRIEQVRPSDVQLIGGRRTMQYRGASLPLIALEDVLPCGQLASELEWIVAVFQVGGREVGMLGARPVDIVETHGSIDTGTLKQMGVIGSTIIRDQTTLILDVFDVVNANFPEWKISRGALTPSNAEMPTVVLAEDSAFFREQLSQALGGMGVRVLAAEDGRAAWQLVDRNADSIRMLVTDIEMPVMGGLELTRKVRGDPRFRELPIIAVTSLAGEEDVQRGRESGVSEYQIKLDKSKLSECIYRYLGHDEAAKGRSK